LTAPRDRALFAGGLSFAPKRIAADTLFRMKIVRRVEDLEEFHGAAFVPTMGALHRGHLALIDRAHQEAANGAKAVVSIFVNPTQFAAHEDFGRYPRPLEDDLARCEEAGVHAVFVPEHDVIYPPGVTIAVPQLPDVAVRPQLEDALRPAHFAGVAQVVARLFDLVRPSCAVFGEKDYQQLRVIEALVAAHRERWPDLRIAAHPTVRESDGLAMSSRNIYLQPDERNAARGLFRAMQSAAAAQHPPTAMRVMRDALEMHGLQTQYAEVRDAQTLMPVSTFERPTRALVAARLGSVRLIDNLPLPVWS